MNISACSVLGVVLAGGASSRMGRDKAELPWHDGNLLDTMKTLLRSVCDDVVVCGRQDGIVDQHRHGGPLLAIQTLLLDARVQAFDVLLICAVDTPFLSSADLQSLLRETRQRGAAHFQSHYLPLALRVSPSLSATLNSVAQQALPSQRSLHGFLQQWDTAVLELAPEQQARFVNLNTPELYQRYR